MKRLFLSVTGALVLAAVTATPALAGLLNIHYGNSFSLDEYKNYTGPAVIGQSGDLWNFISVFDGTAVGNLKDSTGLPRAYR